MAKVLCPNCLTETTFASCKGCKIQTIELTPATAAIYTMARAINGMLLHHEGVIRILIKNTVMGGYCHICGKSACTGTWCQKE